SIISTTPASKFRSAQKKVVCTALIFSSDRHIGISGKHLPRGPLIRNQDIDAFGAKRSEHRYDFIFSSTHGNIRLDSAKIVKGQANHTAIEIRDHRFSIDVKISAGNVAYCPFSL